MATDYIVVFCTVPDQDTAQKIAHQLVEEKLAACCNIIPGLKSIYTWENKIQEDAEYLLLIKSRQMVFSRLEDRIKEIHPYSIPEIIALPIIQGNKEYLKWIGENVEER